MSDPSMCLDQADLSNKYDHIVCPRARARRVQYCRTESYRPYASRSCVAPFSIFDANQVAHGRDTARNSKGRRGVEVFATTPHDIFVFQDYPDLTIHRLHRPPSPTFDN